MRKLKAECPIVGIFLAVDRDKSNQKFLFFLLLKTAVD